MTDRDAPSPAHPEPRRSATPDPGSPRAARLAGWLLVALIGAVALVQQLGSSSVARSVSQGPAPAAQARPVDPPDATQEMIAKILLKLSGVAPSPILAQTARDAARTADAKPEDRLRQAVLLAELDRAPGSAAVPAEALAAIDGVIADAPEQSPLRADARAVRALLTGEPLPPEPTAKDLKDRHGVFAALARAYRAPDTDPARRALVGGGQLLIGLLLGAALLGGVALITGLTLLVAAIVARAQGRWRDRFVPPAPGGSVMLETAAVFVIGFLLLKALHVGVSRAASAMGLAPEATVWIVLTAQWLLLLAVLWPLARGVRWGEARRLLGLHAGRGVLREAGCGVLGYLACLPLYAAGAIVSTILLYAWGVVERQVLGRAPEPPSNPVIDLVSGSRGSGLAVLIFMLAALWAPLAEELIFRGALYRHLRGFAAPLVAGGVSALAFGLMHGYPVIMLGPVIALGFGFSLMREWRDSLVAPMVAHCLHNATVLLFLLAVLRLLG